MKIAIETLSPVHIGSGIQYEGNSEYIYFEREKELVVLDEAKVLDIIGIENIHIWFGYIEKKTDNNFLDYLKQRRPTIQPKDIATRVIKLKGNIKPYSSNTLREHIHNGLGIPYVPGSSIKGAIRTAFLSEFLFSKYKNIGLTGTNLSRSETQKNNNTVVRFKDKILQQEAFGNDPNSDWMRLLQVGDCYFKNSSTHAAFAETLNEHNNLTYKIKNDVKQLIEYLPKGSTAEFDIHIPSDLKKLILQKKPNLFYSNVVNFNISYLLSTINKQSQRLISEEIEFFETADLPENKSELPFFLEEMLSSAQQCGENECILRMGFGTGYRNMTGNWAKDLVKDDALYDEIATASRRTSKYNQMPLPKSRKVMFDGEFLGYVKLKING